jgi:tetratricopeptide (TPR) repeat protein
MAYLKLKNYNQVVDDANAALKIDSKYLKAYHRRGKAYFELRKYEQAIKDFQLILEKEPDNKDINQSLMDARYRLNNPDEDLESKKGKTPKQQQQTVAAPQKEAQPQPKLEE